MKPLKRLGSMGVDTFMAEYWQERPALLRGVFPADFCPVSPEDLLELSLGDDADSRLIVSGGWPPELYHGPFDEEDFADLPDSGWTLLVQEVDRLLPQAAEVLSAFRFISNWRVDDLMVSFAAPGGGVGAHVDQYDVFLIQGSGRRRWEIGLTPDPEPVWREDSDVAVMADFQADEAWELEPGDVLYLPPHIPHNGVALEPCVTLSVGFRAPSALELLENMVVYAREEGLGTERLLDAAGAEADPGLLGPDLLRALRSNVRGLLADDATLDLRIGRSVTEPVRGRSGEPAHRPLPPTGKLHPSSAAQMAYIARGQRLLLFAAGQVYELDPGIRGQVRALTGTEGLDLTSITDDRLRAVVEELYADGTVRLA